MNKLPVIILIIFYVCPTVQSQSSPVNGDFRNKVTTFWRYVSRNEAKIFSLDSEDIVQVYEEINKRLHLINENLTFISSNEIINNKRDVIITAGGNSSYFELCDKIVEMSPRLIRLNPVSLIPQMKIIDSYIIGGIGENIEFSVDDVRVNFAGTDNDVSLLFILNNYHLSFLNNDRTGQFYSVYSQLLNVMLLQVLGEKIVADKIQAVHIAPLSTIIPSVPLMELREYIH